MPAGGPPAGLVLTGRSQRQRRRAAAAAAGPAAGAGRGLSPRRPGPWSAARTYNDSIQFLILIRSPTARPGLGPGRPTVTQPDGAG